jgi:polyisoprenoid-binding protein YceI
MRGPGLLFLAVAGVVAAASAQQLPIPDGTVREGTLGFDGKASVGDFTGVTATVSGRMEGAATLGLVRGFVEAPVATLKTGKDRRDRDLNRSMESDKYPTMRFDLTSVDSGGGPPDSLSATLHGRLTLHGVTRDVELPALLSLLEDGVRVRTTFPVNLTDYQIGGLSKMLGVLKMDEHITVHVDVRFDYIR